MTLKGKTVVVTGAASGIGRAGAALMRERGARIVSVDRNRPDIEVDDHIAADLGDPESIADAAAALPAGIGGLCNIAGLPPAAGPEAVLRVNFLGLRAFTEALIPKLAGGASIVNLASLAGQAWPEHLDRVRALIALRDFADAEAFCERHGVDDVRSYFLSKEAVIVWTMQNRWTWRDRDIRINCISPGPVETPILPDFLAKFGDRPSLDKKIIDRFGTVDDIAPVIAFLIGDDSAWIRGANIPVDGGVAAFGLARDYALDG